MSNIYITEPQPSGKVIFETSKGDIEVELWSRECPKACRNLISLALEGYYDNMIWHRVVKDFIIQTGDPTGTGTGGESVYGQPFQDEPHQRLRFNRRGLLGMANASEPHSNDSQFFLTLGSTPELQNKHTLFGRVSGPTIYNLVNLADVEVGNDDRPVYPPKLLTIRVVDNPFDDIVPRVTKEEKRQQEKARKEAVKRREEREGGTGKSRQKNTALLSFGESEEGEANLDAFKGKPKSSHDLLQNDRRLRTEVASKRASFEPAYIKAPPSSNGEPSKRGMDDQSEEKGKILSDERKRGKKDKGEALEGIRARNVQSEAVFDDGSKIAELESSIRGLSRKAESQGGADGEATKKQMKRGKALLEEYRSKYSKKEVANGTRAKSKAKDRDRETSDLLMSFQNRMRRGNEKSKEGRKESEMAQEEVPEELREYGAGDDEGDDDWRNHRFDFGGRALLEDKHDNEEYVTLDPRDSSSSKAIALGFGGKEGIERARQNEAKQGRRGRDWVDERDWERKRDRHYRHGESQRREDGGANGRDRKSVERTARMEKW